MARIRPYVLTVAGFDPSGGAGILADIKAFEQCKVYGFAVLTANTIQNEDEVVSANWIDDDLIVNQLHVLFQKHRIQYFKIGIVRDAAMFSLIKKTILDFNPKAHITWDPVLKASTGTPFFEGEVSPADLLKGISLVTPNLEEFKTLFGDEKAVSKFSEQTKVYLKGGHRVDKPGVDTIYDRSLTRNYRPKTTKLVAKHGSGCVLSSALTAHLARGFSFHQSCLKSKRYIETVLGSNHTALAYHKL